MKFEVVGEQSGQPIGFGRSVVRQLAQLVDTLICHIGHLGDGNRQTIAGELLTTIRTPRSRGRLSIAVDARFDPRLHWRRPDTVTLSDDE